MKRDAALAKKAEKLEAKKAAEQKAAAERPARIAATAAKAKAAWAKQLKQHMRANVDEAALARIRAKMMCAAAGGKTLCG